MYCLWRKSAFSGIVLSFNSLDFMYYLQLQMGVCFRLVGITGLKIFSLLPFILFCFSCFFG